MNPLVRGDSTISLMQAAKERAQQQAALQKQEAKIKNIGAINKAAKDFEATFISQMMKPMFKEVNKPDPMFGGGKGEQVFNDMMVQQYGKLMAERGGFGIADKVKAELIRIQEVKEQQHGNR